MLSKRSLRILVVTDLLLVALSVAVGFVDEAWLLEPLQAYQQAQCEADMTTRDWVILGAGIPLLIGVLVSSIGFLVFWRPARPLYLVTAIVATLLTALAGPYVSPGWAQAVDHASSIITGVVLAVIYFSPLRDLYERPKSAG